MLDVHGFDHLVLRCIDVETTLAWYIDRLGMPPVRVDEWRAGVAPFPSVRVDEGTIIDLIPGADVDSARGHLDHLCLVVGPADVDAVATDPAFNVIDGPGPRYGARGVATSVYVTDPDNVIEEFRTNDGVVGGMFEGASLLLLHHKGAKSGTERVNPLVYLRDGDKYVIFASKAGAPTSPDWYHNLRANPDTSIEVGIQTIPVTARVAEGDEREQLWSKQKEVAPQFAEYEAKTDRVIPVVVLESA